ncbi:MAG: adenosylcobalamin-dependent ribonucleoside-diphosphate reductase [Geminicoccales bacterium]
MAKVFAFSRSSCDGPIFNDVSLMIWRNKYRRRSLYTKSLDHDWLHTVGRVLQATSSAVTLGEREILQEAIEGLEIVPAGRILAGAGTTDDVTLVNTFVIGSIEPKAMETLAALVCSARTMSMGGGIGLDLSRIPPRGVEIGKGTSPGILAYAELWDQMCRTIVSSDAQRGAMMVVLRCDHPEIEEFIQAKCQKGVLTNLNASVLVTDDFLRAKNNGSPWALQFDGRVHRHVDPQRLWSEMASAAYVAAEPGMIFIDRINRYNNLGYCEKIVATNSCAEQPLPEGGSAPLASINLAALVRYPFTSSSYLDLDRLRMLARLGVRFLDRVVDQTRYPDPAQLEQAHMKRRIGLGIKGLGDALILLGHRYGSHASLESLHSWLSAFRDASYRASIELARERRPFPLFNAAAFLDRPFIKTLNAEIQDGIRRYGIRNAVINCIAPTGSTALLANNVSGGIEPVYAHRQRRRVMMPDHSYKEVELKSWSLQRYLDIFPGRVDGPLPMSFATALDVHHEDHLAVQAAAQRYIDGSISKTINFAADIEFDAFEQAYELADNLGCKSLSVYRPSAMRGQILSSAD